MDAKVPVAYSTCPHDCPSTCALEIELLQPDQIGRVRGDKAHPYTDGVICAKVARYAERAHHPDRLMHPMRRRGNKGDKDYQRISWDDALDLTAEAFLKAEQTYGAEAVWPYYFAGTMGHLMRDGINRLRHAKGYSRQINSICSLASSVGWVAATGAKRGVDPREMAESDCVIVWGTNPVNTQVNVMTHIAKARKSRGTKLIVIDVYRNSTMEQADLALCLRPGTDGALACAIMHILFRDGHADREYMAAYADAPEELEEHLAQRTPEWASAITGLNVSEIEAAARMIGERPRSFFRLGYGFTRQNNGSVAMHAAVCVPTVLGAWKYRGGGALFANAAIYGLNKSTIEGQADPATRLFDMSRIGPVLTGNSEDLQGGPPVTAMVIQNMNPIQVAPEQALVRQGFLREDLFTCIHEQFMTASAELADVVLPATMFLEHNDVYTGGGHTFLMAGARIMEPPGECRSNHWVICELAKRLGIDDPSFAMSETEMLDATLQASGHGSWNSLVANKWLDCASEFDTAHYLDGFAWPDRKFRFRPSWHDVPFDVGRPMVDISDMPALPDHWDVIEQADSDYPFKLTTSPARGYLNSSFNEMPTSQAKEGRPTVMMHPEDAAGIPVGDGDEVEVASPRGAIRLHAELFDGLQRGVVVIESIPPNAQFAGGDGLNTLTSAVRTAPYGGAAFHDNKVRITPV